MITLAVTAILLDSNSLIIISNTFLAFSTLLLFFASEHEQHQTIKAILKANSTLARLVIKAFSKKSKK